MRELYASATGSSVRVIAADVLEQAPGSPTSSTTNGVTLNDIVERAVYPVLGVMDILRQLADDHGAIVTVDNLARDRHGAGDRADALARSRLHRTGEGRQPALARAGPPNRGTTPTGASSSAAERPGRSRMSGPATAPPGSGTLSQVPEEVLEVTLAGVNEEFEGTGAVWTIDQDAARITRVSGESTPGIGARIKIAYVAREAIVITTDDAAAVADDRVHGRAASSKTTRSTHRGSRESAAGLS